jgi:hypothetical protein
MTHRTLDLTTALREAQLQRLEASLLARSTKPPSRTPGPVKQNEQIFKDE